MRIVAVAALVSTLLAGTSANAGETDSLRYYGWEILIADAAAWGIMFGTRGDGFVLAAGVYALVPPAIHIANDEPLHAGLSLGLRIGAPYIGGQIAASSSHWEEYEEISPAVGGIVLGFIAAELIDATLLGWHTEHHVQAAYSPTRGGGVLTLSGQF